MTGGVVCLSGGVMEPFVRDRVGSGALQGLQ